MLTYHALGEEIHYNEEVDFLQESIKRFGPPRPLNYENCSFPGPEISADDLAQENRFIYDVSGNYTLK